MRGTLAAAVGTLAASFAAVVAFEVVSPSVIYEGDHKLRGAQTALRILSEAVRSYRAEHSSLPGSLDQLTGSGAFEKIPTDPWGGTYIYRHGEDGEDFEVYSSGIDAIDQGGLGDDVVTGDKEYQCKPYGASCPLPPLEAARLVCQLLFLLSVATSAGLLVALLSHRAFGKRAT
jgi:hypothetical protein